MTIVLERKIFRISKNLKILFEIYPTFKIIKKETENKIKI